jgi:D-alanine--poly(phosphoribitol) ligase subunit 1
MWILDELQKAQKNTRLAFKYGEETLSFQSLWERSEALAGYLAEHFPAAIKAKTPMVLYGAKEINLVPAMHAALKCGIPYVPVDTLYPVERLKQIIGQVQAQIVINLSGRKVEGDFTVVDESALLSIFQTYKDYVSDPENWAQADDVCYILFTSGSTGKPKGVQICKKNILCFADWYRDFCPAGVGSTCLNQVSYSFDVSVIPLYVYLPQLATLFNVDNNMLADFKILEAVLSKSGLTDWVSTPALFDICLFSNRFNQELLPSLKRFSFAGEVMTKKLVRNVWERFGKEAQVINGYGPTETTVLLTACTVTEAMLDAEDAIPIGKPNPALGYKLVPQAESTATDEQKEISAAEKAQAKALPTGEFLVWGGSVGIGYYHNEEQTAKNFFEGPAGTRGYRTGDLVYLKNGYLYYLGRKDFQLKLNGYRIEPDDISNNINRMETVENSIVLPYIKDGKVEYLAAFVKMRQSEDKGLKVAVAIKKFLKTVVPVYMIPKKIIFVDQFPMNVNGKIDRKKLLEALS